MRRVIGIDVHRTFGEVVIWEDGVLRHVGRVDMTRTALEGLGKKAAIASLVETCKLHGVDPQAYFADVLTKLVNLWPASRLDELMPWAWAARRSTDRLAA